jgi:hypothetical protein
MSFIPTDLPNLWGWWKADSGLTMVTEAPKAELAWDASGGVGAGTATALGAGPIDCIFYDPISTNNETLGSMTITGSETDSQFVTTVFNAIKNNTQGYRVALVGQVLYVEAKTGGSAFNGNALTFNALTTGSSTTSMTGGSDTPISTNKISQWSDSSGQGHHLVSQSSKEGIVIANAVNSLPSVGVSQYKADMRTAANFPDITSTGVTVYVVMKKKPQRGLLLAAGDYNNIKMNNFGATGMGMGANNNPSGGYVVVTANDNIYYTLKLRTDNINDYGGVNSVETTQYAIAAQSYSPAVLSLFNLSGFFGDYEIAELIIYTSSITGNNNDLVEYYLNQKYNHYTWTGPVVGLPVVAVINFGALAPKYIGDADYSAGATSNSPAPITYSSSDTNVATIVSGQIHLTGPGSTTITAHQSSTTGYTSATPASQVLTVLAQPVAAPVSGPPAGLWFIDGIDIWQAYGIILEEGSADFLKYAPKKPSTEHDWQDSDGLDVDLSRIFLSKREGVLNFAIFSNTNQDYFDRHDAFIALWTQPGLRRLELASHNNRSYYIFYEETTNWDQVIKLKPLSMATNYKIAHRFSIRITEPEPKRYPNNIFIVTESGKFLIS